MKLTVLILVVGVVAAHAHAEVYRSKFKPTAKCLAHIQETSDRLGLEPMLMVETDEMHTVAFVDPKGPFLVSCITSSDEVVVSIP